MYERNQNPDDRNFRRQSNQNERRNRWNEDDYRSFGDQDERYNRSSFDFDSERYQPYDRSRSSLGRDFGSTSNDRRYEDFDGDDQRTFGFSGGRGEGMMAQGRMGSPMRSSGREGRWGGGRENERWMGGQGQERWESSRERDWGSSPQNPSGSSLLSQGFAQQAPYGMGAQRGLGSSQRGEESHSFQGRTGQHMGRGPKGYMRSDDRIKEELCDELTRNPEVDASEIEVQVRSGEVTLSGSVHNRQEKRLAEDLSETILGVKEVHNQIRVQSQQQAQGSSQSHGQLQTQGSQGSSQSAQRAESRTGSSSSSESSGSKGSHL